MPVGGSVFPTQDDTEAEQHIGNVHVMLSGEADQIDGLLDTLGLPFDTREKLWSAAWSVVSSYQDSAFLFGAFVGLELAALNGAPVVIPKRRTAKKGGTR